MKMSLRRSKPKSYITHSSVKGHSTYVAPTVKGGKFVPGYLGERENQRAERRVAERQRRET